MKKKICICLVLFIVLSAVLFVPIPTGVFRDGGTRSYTALTYKIVVWNRLISEEYVTQDGTTVAFPAGAYHRTAVYWFSDSQKTIDELWEIEQSRHNINDHLLPEG